MRFFRGLLVALLPSLLLWAFIATAAYRVFELLVPLPTPLLAVAGHGPHVN
jgi:hypothetical protein